MAQSQVDEAQKLLVDVDKKLAESKVLEVERMAQFATSQNNNNEEEVPEAYLREDWNKYAELPGKKKSMKKVCSLSK